MADLAADTVRHAAVSEKFTSRERAALTDGSGRSLQLPEFASSLRPKQISFARFVAGGFAYRAAAELAGYQYTTDASARNHGSEMASDPRIAELIRVFTQALIKSTAPTALGVLVKVATDDTAKNSDRVKAAKGLIDKTIPTVTRHETQGRLEVEHAHHVEVQHKIPSLDALYLEAGLTPPGHALPAPTAEPIDVEFEEIAPAAADPWSV